MTKFKDTYRIETTRLKVWDYANPWWYYITINTKDHVEYFGRVEYEKMVLNGLGKIVEEEWLKTKNIRANVELVFLWLCQIIFMG
ncbi:MAG: transposase [Ignavibacteria bacterium]|nr:MAG: transposase [Ignavibacteria bacterium]KAF0156054.1 MAG: transposase [Ignavibacteria bacterium]